MRFSDIPTNQNIKNQLLKANTFGRISHAHLFVTENGSSGLAMALAFAQYLLCQDKTEKDSCGKCSSCLKCEKLAHPDLHYIFPVVTNKTPHAISEHYLKDWRMALSNNPFLSEDEWYIQLGAQNKQGFISAHEASNLSAKLSLKPYENSYRIVILWHADKMHPSAANKLLKVLEEPPPKTIFVLLSPSKEVLLDTIVSRLQCTTIPPCSENELYTYLVNRFDSDERMAREISALSQGNIGRAIKLMLGNEQLEQNTREFQTLMRLCYQANVEELSLWVETISRWGREPLKGLLNYALHMIRECLIFNFADSKIQRLTDEEMIFVKKFAPFVHSQNMPKIIAEIERAHTHITRNGSSKFVFMDLALKLAVLLHAKKVTLQTSISE